MTVMPAREQIHVYGASDYAVSAGRGDWTVHVVVGLDTTGQLYLLDCWRKQARTDEGVDAFLDLVKQWKPIGWACEKGQLANAIEPFMLSRRCQSIRGRLGVGNMVVPTQAEWWPEVRARGPKLPRGSDG